METEQIIYLYSNVSEASKQVKPQIETLMKLSKIPIQTLNVDSKGIREMIQKSKSIKVTRVPALIIRSKMKNKIEVYEGSSFYTTITQLINAFTLAIQNDQNMVKMKEMQMKTQMSSTIPNMQQNRGQVGKTSLNEIFDESENQEINNKGKKYGKTKLNMPDEVSPFAQDGRMMLGSLERPIEGEGHDEMGHSSISRFGMTKDNWNPNEEPIELPNEMNTKNVSFQEDEEYEDDEVINVVQKTPLKPAIKKVPVKVGKKVEMLEDLDSIFQNNSEEDNYGIEVTQGDIDQYRGEPAKRDDKTVGMDNIKKQAELMMQARQTDMDGPRRR